MIRLCTQEDLELIGRIINDGAQAYQGVIPEDRLQIPYMTLEALREEIGHGVIFWGFLEREMLAGVMGIQTVKDVTLIRHAYVGSQFQRRGIGAALLTHLCQMAGSPILIGTWADATWAIRFYERHGFELISSAEKNVLLRTYWSVPDRQIATSVVLADQRWRDRPLSSPPSV